MLRKLKSFVVDLWGDGQSILSFSAPAISLAISLAKYFEMPIAHDLSYAWVFVPLMLWFFVAYIRRRAQTNRSWKIAKLQEFYVEVGPIIQAALPRDITPEAFNYYDLQANNWLTNTAEWIGANMGMGARERFLDRTGMLAMSYSGAVNGQHGTIIGNLTRHRKNLISLIESNAWDA